METKKLNRNSCGKNILGLIRRRNEEEEHKAAPQQKRDGTDRKSDKTGKTSFEKVNSTTSTQKKTQQTSKLQRKNKRESFRE